MSKEGSAANSSSKKPIVKLADMDQDMQTDA